MAPSLFFGLLLHFSEKSPKRGNDVIRSIDGLQLSFHPNERPTKQNLPAELEIFHSNFPLEVECFLLTDSTGFENR